MKVTGVPHLSCHLMSCPVSLRVLVLRASGEYGLLVPFGVGLRSHGMRDFRHLQRTLFSNELAKEFWRLIIVKTRSSSPHHSAFSPSIHPSQDQQFLCMRTISAIIFADPSRHSSSLPAQPGLVVQHQVTFKSSTTNTPVIPPKKATSPTFPTTQSDESHSPPGPTPFLPVLPTSHPFRR